MQHKISQTYPGLILGFIQVEAKYGVDVQSSNNPISMEKMTQEFICKFNLPSNTPTSVVEIDSISNPLCVFKNYGGSESEYFVRYLKGNGLGILVIKL